VETLLAFLSDPIALAVLITGGLLGVLFVTLLIRGRRKMIRAGIEAGTMIGATVIASTALEPKGWVKYGGAEWAATLDPPTTSVPPDTDLEVVSVERLHLFVRPRRLPGLPDAQTDVASSS
jgi:membrane-bound ClpP family serine protease